MWQAPSQRARALAITKKRERDRNRHVFHIKRVWAEIKINTPIQEQPPISKVRVVLNDFSPTGVGFFAQHPLMVGQELAFTLEEPCRLYVKGKVIWCQEFDVDSHVLSSSSFSYRMGIRFVFESPEEAKAMKGFCDQLAKDHLYLRAA